MLNALATIKILSDQIKEHGSPYERGMADSYYGRGRSPHKVVNRHEISLVSGTEEFQQYMDGYDHNEELGNFKCWGEP